MTNRRHFLQLGFTVSVASFMPAGTLAASGSQASPFPVYRILHDTRFPASMGHAISLQDAWRLDLAPMQALAGDITRFWRDDLSRVWRESPQALAGVTGASVLFCLEQMARDHQLRVQWRQELGFGQGSEPGEALVAWLIAPA